MPAVNSVFGSGSIKATLNGTTRIPAYTSDTSGNEYLELLDLHTVDKVDTTTVSTSLADIAKGIFTTYDWQNAANTEGVRFSQVGYAEHSTNNDIEGVGHIGGILGYVQKTGTGTDALVIGVEGRVGAVEGTITIASSFIAAFDTNTENDAGHITNKFSFFSDDPNWTFRNDGPAIINGKISQDTTITAGGVTGAQEINKPTGSVNFAGGATSLVVTNSLCTANSIVIPVVQTIDAAMFACFAVCSNGSFTLYPVGTPVGEVKVSWVLMN